MHLPGDFLCFYGVKTEQLLRACHLRVDKLIACLESYLQAIISCLRAFLGFRIEPLVKSKGAVYVPHLFVDQTNAPAEVLAQTIAKACAHLQKAAPGPN